MNGGNDVERTNPLGCLYGRLIYQGVGRVYNEDSEDRVVAPG